MRVQKLLLYLILKEQLFGISYMRFLVGQSYQWSLLMNLPGYKMDEHDPDSAYLRLQFSKFPGPRSGGSGSRGKR